MSKTQVEPQSFEHFMTTLFLWFRVWTMENVVNLFNTIAMKIYQWIRLKIGAKLSVCLTACTTAVFLPKAVNVWKIFTPIIVFFYI